MSLDTEHLMKWRQVGSWASLLHKVKQYEVDGKVVKLDEMNRFEVFQTELVSSKVLSEQHVITTLQPYIGL